MKVYLDDERTTPEGWIRVYTASQAIELLKTRCVSELSLDNDLGEELEEGYTVADWLEEQVFLDITFPIPSMIVHSANSARIAYMKRAFNSIMSIRAQQNEELAMKYEVWQYEDNSIAIFPVSNASAKATLSSNACLIRTIIAKDWHEAMVEHHKLMGWEPYNG